jgi:multidrug efflux pump
MLSALLAFLVLAALYESWTIPLAVLLTVPLGILGAVAAATLRGLPNDVYFTVSIVTIIGLAAKDGILIIEFAKALREQGQPIRAATIAACRMRFRPIVMTGLAFVFGVAPMIVASGAGAKSQQALGTSVMGGMTAVVALALLMVPVFFVSVQAAFSRQAGKNFGPRQLPRRNRRRSRPTPAPGQVWRGDRQGNTRRYLAKPTLRRPSTKGSKSAGFLCGSTLRRCSTE